MRNKTTAAFLGALTIGALAWLGAPAGAGPDSNRTPLGGSTAQKKKPWGCEDKPSMVECSECCIDQAAQIQAACVNHGFDEDFCMNKAQQAIATCEAAACNP